MGEKAGGEKRWILITFEWFFQGRYNGLWSYLPMTNMTKEDNSAAALAILHVIYIHACWYDWMRKITLVDILSAAWRQHRERCDWVQSALVCGWWKHTALFLLLPFFFWISQHCVCSCCSHFSHFPSIHVWGVMTPWENFIFGTKKTNKTHLRQIRNLIETLKHNLAALQMFF